jgi:predicted peptidase
VFAGLTLAITWSVLAAPALAQPGRGGGAFALDPRVESRTYALSETGEDMPYCMFASSRVDPATAAPLIISLHGFGAGPEYMCNSTAVDLAEAGGYILAAPMGYNTSGWYGVPAEFRRAVGRGGGAGEDPERIGALSEQDVMNVLAMMREEFNVDANRIYLTGHSMGAAGTAYLGSKYADIWAAIAPVAGGVRLGAPEILQRYKAAGLPMILVVGDADETVAVAEAREYAAALQSAGIEHEYVELPGLSHGPAITASQPYVYAFFDKHSK